MDRRNKQADEDEERERIRKAYALQNVLAQLFEQQRSAMTTNQPPVGSAEIRLPQQEATLQQPTAATLGLIEQMRRDNVARLQNFSRSATPQQMGQLQSLLTHVRSDDNTRRTLGQARTQRNPAQQSNPILLEVAALRHVLGQQQASSASALIPFQQEQNQALPSHHLSQNQQWNPQQQTSMDLSSLLAVILPAILAARGVNNPTQQVISSTPHLNTQYSSHILEAISALAGGTTGAPAPATNSSLDLAAQLLLGQATGGGAMNSSGHTPQLSEQELLLAALLPVLLENARGDTLGAQQHPADHGVLNESRGDRSTLFPNIQSGRFVAGGATHASLRGGSFQGIRDLPANLATTSLTRRQISSATAGESGESSFQSKKRRLSSATSNSESRPLGQPLDEAGIEDDDRKPAAVRRPVNVGVSLPLNAANSSDVSGQPRQEDDTGASSPGGRKRSQSGTRRRQPEVSFALKLYDLLMASEVEGYTHIISFTPEGNAFMIHDSTLFLSTIIPRHFNQKQMSSFKRQLNAYGFERIPYGPYEGGFIHKEFRRGERGIVAKMQRVS